MIKMKLENILKQGRRIAIGTAVLFMNSCSYIPMKGFDRIFKNEMPREKLEIKEVHHVMYAENMRHVSTGKYGGKVFEYDLDGNSEIYFMRNGRTFNISNSRGYDGEPEINALETDIIFTSDRSGSLNIHVADLKEYELIQTTDNTKLNFEGSISDSGNEISYTSGRPGNLEVYFRDRRKNYEENVSKDEADDSQSCISGDGKKIGFISGRDWQSGVYIIDVKTKELTTVKKEHGKMYFNLKLNFDGSKAGYSEKDEATKNNMNISFIDLKDNREINWTWNNGYDGEPAIDSAGRYVVYVSKQKGLYEREERKSPLHDRASNRIIEVVKTDKHGNIGGSGKYVKLKKKRAEDKIIIADTKTGMIKKIESIGELGYYPVDISPNGEWIIIMGDKLEGYQIKNPFFEKEKEELELEKLWGKPHKWERTPLHKD